MPPPDDKRTRTVIRCSCCKLSCRWRVGTLCAVVLVAPLLILPRFAALFSLLSPYDVNRNVLKEAERALRSTSATRSVATAEEGAMFGRPTVAPMSAPQLSPSDVSRNVLKEAERALRSTSTTRSVATAEEDLGQGSSMMKEPCSRLLKRLSSDPKQHCKEGPYRSDKKLQIRTNKSAARVALVIRGESFRRNREMYDRNVSVSDETMRCQLEASQSQVKFLIEPLEECNILVDVFIVSWSPEGSPKQCATGMKAVENVFHPKVVVSDWQPHKNALKYGLGGQARNYMRGLDAVANYSSHSNTLYNALLVVRVDLVFKRHLFNLTHVDWSRILFLFHEWERGGGYPAKVVQQRVPETVIWFPWRYVNCAYKSGWKEHDSSLIQVNSGLKSLGWMMPDEYHDANSAADWNPIYTQACRVPQKFDIHFGHAFVMFSVREITEARLAHQLGVRFIESMYSQGDPRLSPPELMVMHSWAKSKEVKKALHTVYGLIPHGEVHETIDTVDDPSFNAILSLNQSFGLVARSQEFQYKKAFHKGYSFDRVAFVRMDHKFKGAYIPFYSQDVSNMTYVGFGSRALSEVPSIILTSHAGAAKLGAWLATWLGRSRHGRPSKNCIVQYGGWESWLAVVTGMHVKRLCEVC